MDGAREEAKRDDKICICFMNYIRRPSYMRLTGRVVASAFVFSEF